MKTLKILGIIALSALIILGAAGCDPEVIPLDLEGTVSIRPDSIGFYVGQTITAVYTGPEDVDYDWYHADQPTTSISTYNYLVPTQPGTYWVVLTYTSPEGEVYNPLKSPEVIIGNRLAGINFFGTWFMDGEKNKFPGTSVPFYNETLVISNGKFRLDSTAPGLNGSGSNKYSGIYLGHDEHDYSSAFEYVEFIITKWEEIPTTQLDSKYSTGFTLTVDEDEGYKTKGYGLYKSVEIYMVKTPSVTGQIELVWGKGIQSDDTTYTPQPRTFVKQ